MLAESFLESKHHLPDGKLPHRVGAVNGLLDILAHGHLLREQRDIAQDLFFPVLIFHEPLTGTDPVPSPLRKARSAIELEGHEPSRPETVTVYGWGRSRGWGRTNVAGSRVRSPAIKRPENEADKEQGICQAPADFTGGSSRLSPVNPFRRRRGIRTLNHWFLRPAASASWRSRPKALSGA